MKFFIAAILFPFAIGVYKKCVTIRRLSYETEVLKIDIGTPYQLVIDYDTNTLFFSYTAGLRDPIFKSAFLSLKNYTYGKVSGIRGGCATAVSSEGKKTVFMGGEDGIYTYDYNTKTATNLNIIKANIWGIFYKSGLYFTTYPEKKTFFYKNKAVVEVPALQNVKVVLIAVTNERDIVYTNSSGVFLYNRAENETILLNKAVPTGITSDIEGNIYFSTHSGIYYFNDEMKEVELLTKIDDNIYGIAVESNGNYIYSSGSSFNTLKSTKIPCRDTRMRIIDIILD